MEPCDQKKFLSVPVADDDTVTRHDKFNLLSCGVVINTKFRTLICTSCCSAVSPQHQPFISHIRRHFPRFDFPEDILEQLQDQYQLVELHLIQYPQPAEIISPVFGLETTPAKFFFCDTCGRGYESSTALHCHVNTSKSACSKGKGVYIQKPIRGYAQRFTAGPHKRWFRVDLDKAHKSDVEISNVASCLGLVTFDYCNEPFSALSDHHGLSLLNKKEEWVKHVEGLYPADIQDMVRPSIADDKHLHSLRQHVVRYLRKSQPAIGKHASFGIPRLLAAVGE